MKKENNQEAAPQEVVIAGRKFNPQDPNVWDQVKQVFEPVAKSAGRFAQENDQLKREIKQSRSYQLAGSSKDINEVIIATQKMAEDGDDVEKINQVWANFHKTSLKEAQNGNEFEIMWRDYLEARPEVRKSFRDKADEEVYKNTLKQNHLTSLDAAGTHQFDYLDQYFEGRIRANRVEEPQAEAAPLDNGPVVTEESSYSISPSTSKESVSTTPKSEAEVEEDFMKSYYSNFSE